MCPIEVLLVFYLPLRGRSRARPRPLVILLQHLPFSPRFPLFSHLPRNNLNCHNPTLCER
jgi:hypothetical protein